MFRCPHCGSTHNAEDHFCPETGQPIEFGPRLMGQTLLEKYKVIEILGEGSVGIVVEVVDINSGRRYAARQIHPRHGQSAQSVDMLFDDAKRAGTMGCKHIANVIDSGTDGMAPTIVQELMVGQSLDVYLKAHAPLPIAEAVKIGREVLIALNAAHMEGLKNFYVCPAEIFLVRSEGEIIVKIVNFGEHHVKRQIREKGSLTNLSTDFLAPEQRRPNQQWDERTDLFLVGMVMYQMLTGQLPARIPVQATTLRKDLPNDLNKIVHQALSYPVGKRYESAMAFLLALEKSAAEFLNVPVEMKVDIPVPMSVPPAAAAAPAEAADTAAGTTTVSTPPAAESPATESTAPAAEVPGDDEPRPAAESQNEPSATDDGQQNTTESGIMDDQSDSAPAGEPTADAATESEEDAAMALDSTGEGPSPSSKPPSVIVEMPEIDTSFSKPYAKVLKVGLIVVVLAAIVGVVAYFNADGGVTSKQASATGESVVAEKVVINIKVNPVNAEITVDGRKVKGNPIRLEVDKDPKMHTIRAKAAGFDTIERDVSFDASKEVKIELIEIIEPSAGDAAIQIDAGVDTATETDQPEAAEPEPTATEAPTAEPEPTVAQPPPVKSAEPKVGKSERQRKGRASADEADSRRKGKKQAKTQRSTASSKASGSSQRPKRSRRKAKSKKTRDGFKKDNPFD